MTCCECSTDVKLRQKRGMWRRKKSFPACIGNALGGGSRPRGATVHIKYGSSRERSLGANCTRVAGVIE